MGKESKEKKGVKEVLSGGAAGGMQEAVENARKYDVWRLWTVSRPGGIILGNAQVCQSNGL